MVSLLIDNRESRNRINSALNHFIGHTQMRDGKYIGKGNVAKIDTLPVGDFIFDNKVVFEYKTASDIISSIIDGRVFRQVEKMKQYPFSYVVIVGNVAETINERNANYWNRKNQVRQFTVRNYLGALARLQVETKVIYVDNNQQCWTVMEYIVQKLLDENPNVRGVDKPKVTLSDPIATFLSCIYINDNSRLGIKTAVMIREYLHLESLSDLLEVEYEDLIKVKGVGVKTAKKIMEVLE